MNTFENRTMSIENNLSLIHCDLDILKMLVMSGEDKSVVIRTIERVQRECKTLDNSIAR